MKSTFNASHLTHGTKGVPLFIKKSNKIGLLWGHSVLRRKGIIPEIEIKEEIVCDFELIIVTYGVESEL